MRKKAKRRGRREILDAKTSKSQTKGVVDKILAEAEDDPGKFVDECMKLGKNVTSGVRAVGDAVNNHPEEVRRLARNEGVRLAAWAIREALK